MSAAHRFRVILRDFSARRLWGVWSRSYLGNYVRRYRRDRSVREVFHRFRQALLRPRRTLLLSATAVLNRNNSESEEYEEEPCTNSITDDELEELIKDIENVAALSRATLFCAHCRRRRIVDTKKQGVTYCRCTTPVVAESSDGWEPFMEAEDVMIWRKEYRKGQGTYAYKVYGRYPEIFASQFAAVQVDTEYRRSWDPNVAALSVLDDKANNVAGQAVIHWEVVWPRMFANRDYVYIRRHKRFEVQSASRPRTDITREIDDVHDDEIWPTNVHARAKRKSLQPSLHTVASDVTYAIISRSCSRVDMPEQSGVVRVKEYWSNMVVRSLHGKDKPGLEYVLTYHECCGGVGGGVASWAAGRAAPNYLANMRHAANNYQNRNSDDLLSGSESKSIEPKPTPKIAEETDIQPKETEIQPKLAEPQPEVADVVPKTDEVESKVIDVETKELEREDRRIVELKEKAVAAVSQTDTIATNDKSTQTDSMKSNEAQSNAGEDMVLGDLSCDAPESNGGWWRYLYPFYYFM